MPLSTSYDVYSGDKSTLSASISATATSGVKAAAMSMNNTVTTWMTPAGVVELRQEVDGVVKVEWFSYTSITTNADNTVTFNGVSRNISRTGSTFTGTGTGQSFNKGADMRLVNHHYLLNLKANLDRANSWSASQTFATGSNLTPTSTTTPVYHGQRLTSTQRDALTGVVNGDWIYNTTLDQTQWYEGGSWVTNATGSTVANGSTTVAGKFEAATAAERAVATATGGTGAILIPTNDALVKTSSGAGDENKIPILGASGTLAVGFLATGSPTGSKFVRDDGVLAVPSFTSTNYNKVVFLSSSSSTTSFVSNTTKNTFDVNSYTIPANELINGYGFRYVAVGNFTWVTGGLQVFAMLAGTTIGNINYTPAATGNFILRGEFLGTAAAGGSVNVRSSSSLWYGTNGAAQTAVWFSEDALATNGTLALQFAAQFASSNASHAAILKSLIVEKISTTAF